MRTFALFAILVAGAAFGTGCKKKTEPTTPSADVTTTDQDRLQGSWSIEFVEDGRAENLRGEEKKRMQDQMAGIRIRFEGNKLIVLRDQERDEEPETFTLDTTANPKVMSLSRMRDAVPSRASHPGTRRTSSAATPENREMQTRQWIYKFEGDTLVVAHYDDDMTQKPAEFKARKDEFGPGKPMVPGITVITLKKNDTPPAKIDRPYRGTPTTATYRPGTKK